MPSSSQTHRTIARRARPVWAVIAVTAAVWLGSCAPPAEPLRSSVPSGPTSTPIRSAPIRPAPTATKAGSGQLRTDLAPLTRRFAALGEPTSAVWCSGTMGDPRAPGPSTYWINAIVRVDPSTAARLRTLGVTDAAPPPDVVRPLRDRLPAGPWLTGGALDAAFALDSGTASVAVAQADPVVVIVALFE